MKGRNSRKVAFLKHEMTQTRDSLIFDMGNN